MNEQELQEKNAILVNQISALHPETLHLQLGVVYETRYCKNRLAQAQQLGSCPTLNQFQKKKKKHLQQTTLAATCWT